MFRLRLHDRRVNEELEAHIADLENEFLLNGMTREAAHGEALQRFGDVDTVRSVLIRKGADVRVACGVLYAAAVLSLSVSLAVVRDPIIHSWLEWASFIGVGLSVIAGLLILTRWVMEFYGVDQKQVLWTCALLALLVSMVITLILDIDNFEVNIHAIALGGLPWKANIHAAYQDILGRAPEQKDIDFYALTRSYEHMEQVQNVLYASTERRLKIDLLYQEELGRHATEEEIDVYVANRFSVEQMRQELSARAQE